MKRHSNYCPHLRRVSAEKSRLTWPKCAEIPKSYAIWLIEDESNDYDGALVKLTAAVTTWKTVGFLGDFRRVKNKAVMG